MCGNSSPITPVEANNKSVIFTISFAPFGSWEDLIVSDFANENYGADVDIDIEKLNTGLNIVTFKNAKIVIEKDPTGNLRIATEYPVY